MQSKSFYTVSLLIFFWLNQLYSQSISDSKGPDQRFKNIENKETFSAKENLMNDTIPKKEPTLLDKVRYNAADYVRINRKESKCSMCKCLFTHSFKRSYQLIVSLYQID